MLSSLLFAAALGGMFELSDHTTFRLREPGDLADTASLDLETIPEARLAILSRRARFTVSYVPRLTLYNMNVDFEPPVLFQEGTVGAEWHDRFLRFSIMEAGGYGGMNLTTLSLVPGPGGTPPRIDAVPVSRVIDMAYSTTTLGMRLTLRRWALDLRTGYLVSGGTTADAQTTLPLQDGPFGEARLDYTATRRSRFTTKLAASELAFSSGPESILVEATERWRYAVSRSDVLALEGGASEVRMRLNDLDWNHYFTYPVAEAMFEHTFKRAERESLAVSLTARVGPIVNRIFGTVDERVQATAHATWRRQRLTVDFFVTANQTVPPDDPNAVQLLDGELSTSYATSKVVAFDVGVRGLAQRLNAAVAPWSSDFTQSSLMMALVYVGVSLHAPPIRF